MLVQRGAVRIVDDAAKLAAVVGDLLADPTTRTTMGASGRMAVDDNRGAVARLMQFLEPLLP
jgi:3-deoxy-D-manno-octulosonic-acid transferase